MSNPFSPEPQPGSSSSFKGHPVPFKKRYYQQCSSECEEASPPSRLTSPDAQQAFAGATQLPAKKRWLKSAHAESPKRKVSLNDYLQRRGGQGNATGSDAEIDCLSAGSQSETSAALTMIGMESEQAPELEEPRVSEVEPALPARSSCFSDLDIGALEARKRQLQEALSAMERRRQQSRNESEHHHHHHHHQLKKQNNVQELRDLERFMKKQEDRLRQRQLEKMAAKRAGTSTVVPTQAPFSGGATTGATKQIAVVRPTTSTRTVNPLMAAIDSLRKLNETLHHQLQGMKGSGVPTPKPDCSTQSEFRGKQSTE